MAEVRQTTHTILASHAEEMTDQVRSAHLAQREVGAVRHTTDSLAKATSRLRLMIEEPYKLIQSRVQELETTQEAAQLLHSIQHFLSCAARLQEHLGSTVGPSLDVVRASYILRELEGVLQDGKIRSIQVVESQLPAIEKHAATVRSKIHGLLSMTEFGADLQPSGASGGGTGTGTSGTAMLASAQQAKLIMEVGTGLQCAYVLGTLSRTVQSFMVERRREVLRTVMRELDPVLVEERIVAEQSRFGKTSTGSSASYAASEQAVTERVVLEHIQRALFVSVHHTQAIILLWRILLQRRDALTQALYLEAVESPVQMLVDYWVIVTDKLKERLLGLQKRHAIRLALSSGYPRYYGMIASFLSRGEAMMSSGEAMPGGDDSGTAASGVNLTLVHISQCGMGDYLHLVDFAEMAVLTSLSSSPSSHANAPKAGKSAVEEARKASAAKMEGLRTTWLSLVSEDLRDSFSTQVMDRYRQHISNVIAKLSSITPESPASANWPASVQPVKTHAMLRPAIPAAAKALDVQSYTRLFLQEVQASRPSLHTMSILVRSVLAATRQLYTKFKEVVSRYPLPPLPSVTAAPTQVQLLHINVANGCTSLSCDLNSVLAMVPHVAASKGMSISGPSHDHLYGAILDELCSHRQALQLLIDDLHQLAGRSTKPFVDAALATLLPTLTSTIESVLRSEVAAVSSQRGMAAMSGGDSRTSLIQLQSQLRNFMERYFFLVDARTFGWTDAAQHLADAVLVRLIIQVTLGAPSAACEVRAMGVAYGRSLGMITPLLLDGIQLLHSVGAAGRTTSVWRGTLQQLQQFYDVCDSTAASAVLAQRLGPPMPVLIGRLLILQFGGMAMMVMVKRMPEPISGSTGEENHYTSVASALAASMRVSEQTVMECVEAILMDDSTARSAQMPHGESAVAVKQASAVTHAIETRFNMLTSYGELAPILQSLWASLPTPV